MDTNRATLAPGTNIKVRDRVNKRSLRQATVIEDRGDTVLVWSHHRAARGGGWDSSKALVPRSRIVGQDA